MAESIDKNIRISVDSRGVKRGVGQARDELGRFVKSTKDAERKTATSAKKMGNAFAGVGKYIAGMAAGFSALQLLRFADDLALVESRIRLFTDSEEELISVQAKLRASAKQTFTLYNDAADTYARLATVTENLNLSQDQLIGIGQGLQQSFRLAGASAEEAASATRQLSQGLGAGALQGDEFRAIQEGNVVLLKLLAEELNVNVGALKQMAADGLITSEVIANSLLRNLDTLNKQTDTLAVTSSQAFNNLKTEFGELVELANEMTNATGGISQAILDFSKYLNENQEAFVTFFTGIQIFAEGVSTFFKKTALTISLVIDEPFEVLKSSLRGVLQFIEDAFRTLDKYTILPGMEAAAEGVQSLIQELGPANGAMREFSREIAELDSIQQKNVLTLLEQRLNTIELIKVKRELAKEGITPELVTQEKDATEQYNEALEKHINKFELLDPMYAKYIERIVELQTALKDGTITQDEFSDALQRSSQKYDDAVKGLDKSGEDIRTYIDELKDTIDGFSRDASQSFADFVTQGKVDFADFANSIINDLIRMTAQKLIFDKAFGAFGSFLEGFGSSAAATPSAKGNVFQNGSITPFARGGVVSKPTIFPMARGAGLMGEAGPEGILPLKRNGRGDLGVQASGMGGGVSVNINVDNQVPGSEARVEEQDDGMGNMDIKILFTQIEDHMANRVSTRKGALFGALHQGGFQGKLR